jgi:hypothetical protein
VFKNNKITRVALPDVGGTHKLGDVEFPNGLSTLSRELFAGNQLSSIVIPNAVTYMYDGVFRDNPITSITIGANVMIAVYTLSDNVPVTGDLQNQFATVYNQGGKKAGRYTLSGGRWVYIR